VRRSATRCALWSRGSRGQADGGIGVDLNPTGLTATVAYEYDLDGNRTKAVRTVGGTPTTRVFVYDRTDQLISVAIDGGAAVNYAYDRPGNLTTKVEADGTTTGLRWDTAGRLVGIDRPGTADDPTYGVDALGRIKSRTIAGVTDAYHYLGLSETVHEVDPPSGSSTRGILGAAGERLAVTLGATFDWTLVDAHGDLAALLDTSGAVVRAYRYDPAGEVLAAHAGGVVGVG
jgi:YD repeat-containing protein